MSLSPMEMRRPLVSKVKVATELESNMTLGIASLGYAIPEPVLTDLVCRFTANIPEEEKAELVRVCFQVELAHWFFVDNYCQPGEDLDHLAHIPFNIFALQLFEHTPYLRAHIDKVEKACADFRAYKNKVPVFGGILLTRDLQEVLLVQGFRNQWGFPKGKVNKEEDEVPCAVREIIEETGYDTSKLINKDYYIESAQNDRITRLYIIVGVDRNFAFRPQTAYEIKEISWFSLDELPENKKDADVTTREGYTNANFFTVFSFVRRLKRWIADKLDGSNQIKNFKVTEAHIKAPQNHNAFSGGRIHPEHPFYPIKPLFNIIPNSPFGNSHTFLTPPRKIPGTKRRLNFDSPGAGGEENTTNVGTPFQRTSLSVATLFGDRLSTTYPDDLDYSIQPIEGGSEEEEEVRDHVPLPVDFQNGRGASAWIDFKFDTRAFLRPWLIKALSNDE